MRCCFLPGAHRPVRYVRRSLLAGLTPAILLCWSSCTAAEATIPIYVDPAIPIEVRQGEPFVIYLADDPMNGLMWEAEYDKGTVNLVSEEIVFPEDRDCTRCSWGYY
ncbi:hypothetical protein ACFLUT_01260 [Chloroflexota bacterium]